MPAPRVVMMGVSGCGKSTVGAALAQTLGVPFVEGDGLHPPENVERMRAGVPLTDADRQGWLERIAERLRTAGGQGAVISCSALRRSYRDRLRAAAPDLHFIHLHGGPALVERRLAGRQGHYMPASLLRSQFDTLELPERDETVITLDIDHSPEVLVRQARDRLRAAGALDDGASA